MITLLVSTIIFWLFWVVISGFVERYRRKDYSGIKLRLYQLSIIVFLIVDVLYNYTYGTIIFLELPRWKRNTLTLRLKYQLHENDSYWRHRLAKVICKYLVDPHDPGHCGI